MTEQGLGRPTTRGPVHKLTIELPADLWEKLPKRSPNVTQWIIKALNAQLEREDKERVQNEINRVNYKTRIYD